MTNYATFTYQQLLDEVLRMKREAARVSVENRHISIAIDGMKAEIEKRAQLADDLKRAQENEVRKILKKDKDSAE